MRGVSVVEVTVYRMAFAATSHCVSTTGLEIPPTTHLSPLFRSETNYRTLQIPDTRLTLIFAGGGSLLRTQRGEEQAQYSLRSL